jgi:hypothetical protein
MLLFSFLGCGSEVKLNETPVAVSGKVSKDSQPIGDIVMVFQPLGDGHVRELPVNKDGTFDARLVAGEYAYYVAKPSTADAAKKMRKVSPEYFQGNLSRTVAVTGDQPLTIALD